MSLRQRLAGEQHEAGETLIEILMSTTLMAFVVVAIVGGIGTVLIGSKLHRDQTNANGALVKAMEYVKSTTVSRACATNNSSHPYLTSLTSAGLANNVSITSIEYETIVTSGGSPTVLWSSTLSDCSTTNVLTLQRITLRYTSTDGKVTPELSFVKGDV